MPYLNGRCYTETIRSEVRSALASRIQTQSDHESIMAVVPAFHNTTDRKVDEMRFACTLGCLVLLMGSFVMAKDTSTALFDFIGTDSAKEWQTVNDGVMGGVSDGQFKITNKNTMEFFGTLSLANNGGFASVRTKGKKLGLEKGDTLVAKVKGDGREYQMNLSVPTIQIAYHYRAMFQTKKDEWIEVKIPLDKFEATSFGRLVKNAGPVNPTSVNGLGFMLSDKKAGPFKMEVEWIRVERARK